MATMSVRSKIFKKCAKSEVAGFSLNLQRPGLQHVAVATGQNVKCQSTA